MDKIKKEIGWMAMFKVFLGLFVLCICCVLFSSFKTLQKLQFSMAFFGVQGWVYVM